ncbi:MAG: helix-turn-helix domain-containing protein [Thermoplasmata archaeon]
MSQLQDKIAGEITMAEHHGVNIKKWRRVFKITQTKLAAHMDISPSVISDYEKGRRSPGVGFVKEIVNSLIDIDWKRGGDVVKRFTPPGYEGVIKMREFSTPIDIEDFIDAVGGTLLYSPEIERQLFGYTIIDSLKAILAMKSFDYLRIYGWSTERVLIFTEVEHGRSPMVAIRASPLTPAAVAYVKPSSVDELTKKLAEIERLPLISIDLEIDGIIKKMDEL